MSHKHDSRSLPPNPRDQISSSLAHEGRPLTSLPLLDETIAAADGPYRAVNPTTSPSGPLPPNPRSQNSSSLAHEGRPLPSLPLLDETIAAADGPYRAVNPTTSPSGPLPPNPRSQNSRALPSGPRSQRSRSLPPNPRALAQEGRPLPLSHSPLLYHTNAAAGGPYGAVNPTPGGEIRDPRNNSTFQRTVIKILETIELFGIHIWLFIKKNDFSIIMVITYWIYHFKKFFRLMDRHVIQEEEEEQESLMGPSLVFQSSRKALLVIFRSEMVLNYILSLLARLLLLELISITFKILIEIAGLVEKWASWFASWFGWF